MLYGNQPAGWLTLGTKQVLTGLKRKDFVDYLKKYYSSWNTVVVIAGNIDVNMRGKIQNYFRGINIEKPKGLNGTCLVRNR